MLENLTQMLPSPWVFQPTCTRSLALLPDMSWRVRLGKERLMVVAVRRARTDSDFRQLHQLFAGYEDDLPAPLRHGRVPNMHALRRTFLPPNAALIATHDDVAIGCAAVKAQDDPHPTTAVLLRLFVLPQRRRFGAARLLVTSAIEFARDAGYERLVLDTEKTQLEPAYRLYRSLGFEECEPYAGVSYATPTFMQLALRRVRADDRI